jgi:phage virion morphogenesis protein
MRSISVRASSDKVVVGTNVVYAAIHHFGGQAGRGRKVTIPARPFMMIQDEDWKEINEVSADYLLREGSRQ